MRTISVIEKDNRLNNHGKGVFPSSTSPQRTVTCLITKPTHSGMDGILLHRQLIGPARGKTVGNGHGHRMNGGVEVGQLKGMDYLLHW